MLNIHLTGTLVTIRGSNLDVHGPFVIKIGQTLCPIVTRYVSKKTRTFCLFDIASDNHFIQMYSTGSK